MKRQRDFVMTWRTAGTLEARLRLTIDGVVFCLGASAPLHPSERGPVEPLAAWQCTSL